MRKNLQHLLIPIASILIIGIAFTFYVSAWESGGEGTITVEETEKPAPQIISVDYDSSVYLGDWVTVTIKVKNNGAKPEWQIIGVSLPDLTGLDNVYTNVMLLGNDMDHGATVKKQGESLSAGYGQYTVIAQYPYVYGSDWSWNTGEEHYLKIQVKPKKSGTFRLYVKTVAKAYDNTYTYDPASGTKDQQDNYVKVYNIQVEEKSFTAPFVGSFSVNLKPSESKEVLVLIKNQEDIQISVDDFIVLNKGGFTGSVECSTSLPVNIGPNNSLFIRVKVSAPQNCPSGTYKVSYKFKGTP